MIAFVMLWCALAAAGVAAVFQERERRRLTRNEQFARECMRAAMRNRDELFAELFEVKAREREKDLELEVYRAESVYVVAPAGLVRSKGGEC